MRRYALNDIFDLVSVPFGPPFCLNSGAEAFCDLLVAWNGRAVGKGGIASHAFENLFAKVRLALLLPHSSIPLDPRHPPVPPLYTPRDRNCASRVH